jgi:ABC-type multidrug transport system ATPase subunit
MQTVLGGQAMQQQQQRGPRRVAPPIPTHLTRVRVGREADNDVILDDLLVSRHHAVLDRTPQGWVLTDIGSRNGTFVNGHRVSGTVPLAEGETLGFGQLSYRVERGLLQPVVPKLDNAFAGVDLSVRVESGKLLLQNMGFTLPHGSLIGVIGPSGAGKSTLLGALTGMRPATVGTVLIDGRDLYAHYEEMRRRIGFVPQQDILHPQLNVRRALRYAAELRFPDDVSRQERERRVEDVIQELGLAQQSDLRIDKLSGGQRKRVSVAMELLTAPSTLFLDEPTSGLDPGLDKQVMQTLRHLADGGRTVLVVTHSVANLHLCDRVLVLAPGGRMAFFGPPQQVLPHFGATDYADVFISLQRDPEGCEARFRQSQWANQLGLEQVRQELTSHRGMTAANTAPAPSRQQSWLSQTLTLTRRYAAVSLADRMFGVLLLAMPVVLALISRIIPAENGLHTLPNKSPMMLLLVLVMGGVLTGVMMSIREIVKEKPIFHRETSVGLSVTAYGASKLIFLGVVMVIQTVIMVVLALVGRKGAADKLVFGATPEIMLAILAVTLCAMVTGLAISALVDTSDKSTIALIPYVILQLVFSGAIIEVAGKAGVEQFAWLWPSRWGLGATAASVDGLCGTSKPVRTPTGLDICGHPTKPDSLWDHKAGTWFGDMTMLGVLTALLTVVLFMLLLREGPHRRKGIG